VFYDDKTATFLNGFTGRETDQKEEIVRMHGP
jgi:hypothetical protein